MNKYYSYIRVSTQDQIIDRQEQAIKEYCKTNDITLNGTYIDKATGKNFDRQQYKAMIETLTTGDTVIIKELDRLGRDMNGIKEEWNKLQARGIDIVVVDNEMLSTRGKSDLEQKLISNIVFELLSYMAQKERESISRRTKEGLQQAKARGVKLGRPQPTLPKDFEKYYKQYKDDSITGVEFSKLIDVSRSTLYRYIKQYEGVNESAK